MIANEYKSNDSGHSLQSVEPISKDEIFNYIYKNLTLELEKQMKEVI